MYQATKILLTFVCFIALYSTVPALDIYKIVRYVERALIGMSLFVCDVLKLYLVTVATISCSCFKESADIVLVY